MRTRIAALLLPAALAACVRTNPRIPATADTATREVRNDFPATVDVYAIRQGGGPEVRLGQVFSGRTDRLRLDRVLIGSGVGVAFVAIPSAPRPRTGATRAVSGGFPVNAGDVVRFNVTTDLQSSTAFVKPR